MVRALAEVGPEGVGLEEAVRREDGERGLRTPFAARIASAPSTERLLRGQGITAHSAIARRVLSMVTGSGCAAW